MSSSLFSLSGSVSVSSWFVSYRVPKVFDLLFFFRHFAVVVVDIFIRHLISLNPFPPPWNWQKVFYIFTLLIF
jgi:hypothetical protein